MYGLRVPAIEQRAFAAIFVRADIENTLLEAMRAASRLFVLIVGFQAKVTSVLIGDGGLGKVLRGTPLRIKESGHWPPGFGWTRFVMLATIRFGWSRPVSLV